MRGTLRERGEVRQGPEDTPWGGRIAVFQDPDGNTLQLTQTDWRRHSSACAG
ncbi:VOC family protein [Candidatus Bipolaricaulota sp. J31]